MTPTTYRWGRLLGDFSVGKTYEHPWEVTIDGGAIALFQASFLDATPVYASAAWARELGFDERPLSPLLCLNLGLSFSVHDVSEQAIAHLAYMDVRFPDAGYPGDTVRARSTVLGAKPASSGDRGVVHVRTILENDRGAVLCAFERKALIRAGTLAERPAIALGTAQSADGRPTPALSTLERLPPPLRQSRVIASRSGLPGFFEDFAAGQIYLHDAGKTVGESEHMQLTTLLRNSHPLHFDEVYCTTNSFQKTRVVYGGLVLGWTLALTSRDLCGNALWDCGLDLGAHPNPTLADDTIYALSRVEKVDRSLGTVTLRIVGVKNQSAHGAWSEHGEALFAVELDKAKEKKIANKVVEITRTLLVAKRPA